MKYIESHNIKNHATKLRDFLLDLFFPLECVGCGAEGAWLCEGCFGEIRLEGDQPCFVCKEPHRAGRTCSFCKTNCAFDRLNSAADYDNKSVEKLIKLMKYKFAKSVAPALSRLLVAFWKKNNFSAPENCLVVPVPLHPRRLRWRGFNQAEEIGRLFAAESGFAMSSRLLRRTRNNPPQVKLKEAERHHNVQDCFEVKDDEAVRDKNIILIDDVVTTGSTANECARVLKQAGSGEVWVLAVAKG